MPQIINLFLVIFGVIACGIGLARFQQHPASLLMLVAGLALVTLAYFSDRRRERRVRERKRAAVQQRLDELTRRSWGPGASLQVPGSVSFILLGLFLVAMGGGALYMDAIAATHDAVLVVIGVGFLLPALLILSRALAGVGQPVLELTAVGFTTPLNGRIAWHDVSGIFLSTLTQRSGHQSFFLMFRVKQFARVAPRIHWTDRLLAVCHLGALGRGVMNVRLPTSKEAPQAVYVLARQLWKQATGNDYDWNPQMSEPYNEALKRTSAFTTRIQEPGAIEASLADPQQMSQDMAQIDRDMALIASERKRQLARFRWTARLFVLLALLVAAWPWLRRWLHL